MAQGRFPWGVFSRIVLLQVTLVLGSLTALGVGARYFFKRQFETHIHEAILVGSAGADLDRTAALESLHQALKVYDGYLGLFLVLVAFVLFGLVFWSVRRLMFPLGRILIKARNVLEEPKKLVEDAEESRLYETQSYGELSDLESSLDKIRRDLEIRAENFDREREEQAILMGAISDAILAVDRDGAPLFFNSRFTVVFGKDERTTRNSKLWEMFRAPEILEAFKSALSHGKTESLKAIPFDRDSSRVFFSVSVSPLRRSAGDVYGALGIFHDVTDLKRAEQIRIDFVANVSHELRTPLTSIKGYVDTLIDDVKQDRPVEKEFLDVIGRNTERLMALINDLLDLSSLESHVEALGKTKVSTADLTSRALQQMRQVFEAKEQQLCVDVRCEQVFADPRSVEQVLVNLLDNAQKYTPPKGKITVSWELSDGDDVYLRVSDTGPGIAPEHCDRLFERFYRVDKARSRELGGTGLGLAIVKHIMQRHEGAVWVESRLGQGSTFVCRFPA
ncbi:MAG: ATP-binding protein [Bdellovibrionota bacterium]